MAEEKNLFILQLMGTPGTGFVTSNKSQLTQNQTKRLISSLVPSRPRREIKCDVTRRVGWENSRSVPSLPLSLDSACRPGDEAT